MNILIVDDNQDSVEYISRIIDKHCSEVFHAYNGENAIRIARQKHPDLILLDVMLPDLNGFEVCKFLKANPATDMIQIIMVTARTGIDDLQKGLSMGAYDYIKKPFESAELLARIKAAFKYKKNQTELIDAKRRLEDMNEELAHLAITDSLTQIYNHTFLLNTLKFEFTRSVRFSDSLAFLMIDIDWFKRVNDEHGHLIGDEVLKGVVSLIKTPVRSIDILGRYGGEEFGLILPKTDKEGAMVLAEKIRKTVEDHTFSLTSGDEIIKVKLTISIGVATFPDETINDVVSLVKAADDALYSSKNSGRNKVSTIQ